MKEAHGRTVYVFQTMSQTVTPQFAYPDNVARYCTSNDLHPALKAAVRIAWESFAPVRELTVDLDQDPETGEQTLLIRVASTLSVEEGLRRKRQYTQRLAASASADARERIRLLFDIP